MPGAIEKRRKTEKPAAKKGSKIFSPFRSLGNVTNEVPFAVGSLGATFYIVTSVGRSFQIYDAANLHLLFVSQHQTASKITCLAAHFHYVYAGYGNKVGIFKRGRLEAEIEIPFSSSNTNVNHILVFGEYLVAASSDGDVHVFKKTPGAKIATEFYTTLKSINPKFDGSIVGLIHPPTYLNKVVVATENHLFIMNIRTAKTLYKTPADVFGESLSCIEHAPALDIVAVGTSKGGVFLFHLRKAIVLGDRIVAAPTDTSGRVSSLSFRTDGFHHMVASLSTGDLYFYDLAKHTKAHVYRNCHAEASGGVARAHFLNGQPIVVTNGNDNQLRELVFDPPLSTSNTAVTGPPRHLRSRGGHSAPPVAVAFPNEDKSHFIYSASKDRTFWCFSLRKDAQAQELSQRPQKSATGNRTAGPVASMREKFSEITSFAISLSREGEWDNVVSAHSGETFARTWDSKTKRVGKFQLNTVDGGIVKAVCVSHCGNFALVGSSLGGIGVYNLQSGLLRRKYMLHKKISVTGLAIDGMNRKMVSCGLDGIVGFYNFADSTYLGKIDLGEPITAMIYHKGSDLVACALDDLSLVVIDVVTQKIVRVLFGHTNRITAMDFSPDGRWLVSAGLDGTLRTWDLPTGGCIDGIRLPSVATTVKFSPIGDFLATTHVTGSGISLWTNRAQFRPVSTRHIDESEFSVSLLPSVSGSDGALMIDGALDEDIEEDETCQIYKSVDQIDKDLVTLSVGPRTRYETIVHVDTIKQRNKPKEAPKKPQQAPFFLSLSGESVGDRAVVAENEGVGKQLKTPGQDDASDPDSRLLRLKSDAHNFESTFTRLLRESRETENYVKFLDFIAHASPATLDLEIRSLNSFPPLTEMASFVEALTAGLLENNNYDTYQAAFALFLKHHGDVIFANPEDELTVALEKWGQVNTRQEEKLDELVKFCSGVVDFVSAV